MSTGSHWSIYNIETGQVLPCTYYGDRDYVLLNAPPGHAVIAGQLDHRAQCVVHITDDYGDQQAVVADLPAASPADPLDRPRRERLRPVLRAMAAIDAIRVRPIAEAALALAGGPALSQAARDKLLATEAQLQQLRAQRTAIEQATTQAELDAVGEPAAVGVPNSP